MISAALLCSTETEAWLQALRSLPVETVLRPVLCQLALIVIVARLFFVLFRKLGQPGVVGEIAAGLVLGPSVFGYFFPDLFRAIFHPAATGVDPLLFDGVLQWIFSTLVQIGLVFMLFLIGLEFDFSHLRRQHKSALSISAAGVALPFTLGLAVALMIHPLLEAHPDAPGPVDRLSFALFLGVAMAITAIPVLGRIMLELGIERTRLGAITMASAAVDDATGWILLASVAAVVAGRFDAWVVVRMIALTAAFAAAMIFAIRPVLSRWAQSAVRRGQGELSLGDFAVLLVCIFLAALATNWIGIFAIFGAFLLGAVLSGEREFSDAVARRMRDFVTVFFLPIFFTYTGLRTDIGSLPSIQLWLVCGLVLLTAIVGKFGGCGLAAWLGGFPPRESASIGVLMNTRGLMELIVINVGYELRVIPRSVYCMLVLMALVTTVLTTPVLVRLIRGTELEPFLHRSGFLRHNNEPSGPVPDPQSMTANSSADPRD